MTTLDRDTIAWVIDNLTDYDDEYERGPRTQEMTFRKGGEEHDFKYFFAADIREWLAEMMHQTYSQFLPLKVQNDMKREVTDLEEREAVCSCGWSAKFKIDHEAKNYPAEEEKLSALAGKHTRDEVEKIMERYQYDD